MQPQTESRQPMLQMQTMAFARADALKNVLERIHPWRWAGVERALEQAEAERWARAGAGVQAWAQAVAWAEARARARAVTQAKVRAQVTIPMWKWLARAQAATPIGKWLAQVAARARAQPLPLATTPMWSCLAEMRAEAWGEAEREEWVEARAEAQMMVTYGEVLADSKLMDIIDSIEPKHRHDLARDLWPHSRYWWFIQIIAPITRLPQELLHQILLILIDNASHSPLALMRVSKLWYTTISGIWASLKLGTRTPRDAVARKLKRNQWLLDVVIDTEFDRGDSTPPGAYRAILAAIEAAPRWRSLVVETFPAQTDLPEHLVNSSLQQYSDVVMSRLTTFKFKCPCETSTLLQHLLRILGTATGGELTTVEINSASVISVLAPTYPSIFHSVKVLCLDIPQSPNPVDLLPHLHQLEALTASHLSLPIYHNDVNLPLVHTLRHLTLRAVSIQWMNGRTFHALETCTLLFPLHHHALHPFSIVLPNCNALTFEGYPFDILNNVSAHVLTHLTVKSSCFDRPRGSRQLVRFSSLVLGENRLTPSILHINIEATNRAWIKAFAFMSNLEELVIDNAQPSSLGVKALQALVVHPDHANNLGTTATSGGGVSLVCPSLKRFGLRYRRWLRSTEHFDLTSHLMSIIKSREQSNFALQSFRIWKGSEQEHPLELIEGSGVSLGGFERLGDVKG